MTIQRTKITINMNALDKLKTEHACYKRALVRIQHEYTDGSDACVWASAALNPPPPAPVTLDDLKAALRKFNRGDECYNHIMFYQDESGGIYNSSRDRIFSFSDFREALDYLEGVSKL